MASEGPVDRDDACNLLHPITGSAAKARHCAESYLTLKFFQITLSTLNCLERQRNQHDIANAVSDAI